MRNGNHRHRWRLMPPVEAGNVQLVQAGKNKNQRKIWLKKSCSWRHWTRKIKERGFLVTEYSKNSFRHQAVRISEFLRVSDLFCRRTVFRSLPFDIDSQPFEADFRSPVDLLLSLFIRLDF